MLKLRIVLPLLLVCFLVGTTAAADPPALMTAQGLVEKADATTLIVRPRSAEGRFEKQLTLHLTGTSKIATLSPRMQRGKLVLTQTETDAKDLQPNQHIALIYTSGGAGATLLAAVVQPASK